LQKRPITGGNRPTIEAKETYMVEIAENTFYREHREPMIDEDRIINAYSQMDF